MQILLNHNFLWILHKFVVWWIKTQRELTGDHVVLRVGSDLL